MPGKRISDLLESLGHILNDGDVDRSKLEVFGYGLCVRKGRSFERENTEHTVQREHCGTQGERQALREKRNGSLLCPALSVPILFHSQGAAFT